MTALKSFDWVILICILLLSGFGAGVIGSVAPEVFLQQAIFYILGLAVFFIFSRIDFRVYSNLRNPIYFLALVLFAITLFLGLETRGAVRWIPLGPFRLQFSEIFKPLLVVAFASILSNQDNRLRSYMLSLVWVAVPLMMVFKQPDLGSTLVYAATFLAMLITSGTNLIYLTFSFLGFGFLTPLIWKFLADYQKNRILSFFSPHIDPLGASYNSIQAVITVGSGMLFGRGLGRGTQSHLAFLPERHTDFVFASLAEEMGFVGAISVLVIYFVLIWRIFFVAGRTDSLDAKLICTGIGVMLLSQVFINVGMNVGIVPVTGITLPLLSYGGSSVFSTMIALGIVENIARSRGMG